MTLPHYFARAVAESTWPGVLSLDEFAPGLFQAVSKNHGGLLAAVEDLVAFYRVDEKAIQAAKAAGLVRGHTCGTRSVQVWRGEEDCDWLTLVCASLAVHAAWVGSRRRPGALPPEYPFEAWAREHAALERLQEQLRFWRPTYPQAIPSSPARSVSLRETDAVSSRVHR